MFLNVVMFSVGTRSMQDLSWCVDNKVPHEGVSPALLETNVKRHSLSPFNSNIRTTHNSSEKRHSGG